ncbi:hypothetical protein D3C85_1045090 [compost metagenome]
MRAFLRGFGEEDAVVGEDGDRVAVQMGEAAHQRSAEQGLEFIELGVVHQAADDFAHVEGLLGVGRDHAVQLFGRVARQQRLATVQFALLAPVEVGDAAAGQGQGVFVVLGVVVGHARGLAVHIGTAEVLGADHFTSGGLHQRRAGEEDGGLVAHHDGLVGHGRHIGAAGGAGAHHHGDLRDALGAHVGLVEEDPPEVLAVREHFVLARQVGAAGIHQVDAGQAILAGDGLGAQVLLHRQRVVGTTFHRGVVGHDHAFHAFHATDACDHAGGGYVFAIHLMGGQLADFEKGRARVQQAVDALARQQLAARGVAFLGLGAAAFMDAAEQPVQRADLFEHGRAVAGELRGTGVDLGVQDGHLARSVECWHHHL